MNIWRNWCAASLGIVMVVLCVATVGLAQYRQTPQNNTINNNVRLQIQRAIYGYNGKGDDVTNRVRSQIRDNRIDMEVNNSSMGGDPNKGQKKDLKVVYNYGGKQHTKTAREGDRLHIP